MELELEIFVIFHKKIYPEMYSELTPEEYRCLKFVAVNNALGGDINEWELPIYNQSWQDTKWMNGGVNHHLILNKKVTKRFSGFVQYDMKFKTGSILYIWEQLSRNPNIGVSLRTMNMTMLVGTSTFGFGDWNLYERALAEYSSHGLSMKSKNFPLFHMCIMESSKWYEIMPIVLDIDMMAFESMKSTDPWYRFAITTERNLAIGVSCVVNDVLDIGELVSHERLDGQNNTF